MYALRVSVATICLTAAVMVVLFAQSALAGLFTDSDAVGGNTFATANWGGGPTFYMHNNPTPPTGDTTSQAVLPLDQTAPTGTTFYNYDTDRDSAAGRGIAKGGSGPTETDTSKYQTWQTGALGSNLTMDGLIEVPLWSAMKDFELAKQGSVTVYFRDYNGSTYTEICNETLTDSDWQGGSSSWVLRTVSFLCSPGYTISAGNILELKLMVGDTAASDMWFAYDTTAYDSRLELP